MDTQKALDVKKAIFLFAEIFDTTPDDIVGSISCFSDERFEILKDASLTWNKFESADIVERGKMLGIKITIDNGKKIIESD